MKGKLVKNLSANTLQLIINQVFGLIIFYILSIGLDKNSFGQLNLVLAILLAVFNILSFGIDQVAVRKIASGESPRQILSLYITHVLFSGLIFYGLLLLGSSLFSAKADVYNLLLLIGIGKLLMYFSTPFKQSAIGLERFRLLARMSVISNIVRGCVLALMAFADTISMQVVIVVFITGDLLELLAGVYIFTLETGIRPTISFKSKPYKNLVKQSLPQLGVVMITSALARFDWIFIGVFVSAVKLAEYSFAYKVFEISTLPLLAIAPLLIPWFTRMFKEGNFDADKLKFLIRAEMIVASFTVLLLNICWTPVIEPLTHGKYGVVNEHTLFILSLCIPMQYLCNFFWTIFFAKGQLKLILTAFIFTFAVNILGDIILIPIYKNEGAAIAYLAGFVAQLTFFIVRNGIKSLNMALFNLILCTGCACLCFFLAKFISINVWIEAGISIVLFTGLLLVTAQLQLKDYQKLMEILMPSSKTPRSKRGISLLSIDKVRNN